MKRLLLILGLLVGVSQAQTTTTITGTIKDLSQALVTSGKVTFTLQPSRDTTISGLARFSPQQVVCLINASGLIKAQDGTSVCTLTMNTALNPPGTYYRVDVWPFNVKTASFTFYAVLSTYDWSTVVPTPTTSPAQNFVDIFSTQTIGGNKTWLGTQTYSALNTFNAGAAANFFSSTALNPALTGIWRFADADTICWRNHLNSADVCISKDATDTLQFPSVNFLGSTSFAGSVSAAGFSSSALNTFNAGSKGSFYASLSANPALSGIFRMAAADSLCWRNGANSGDVCISKDANDRLLLPTLPVVDLTGQNAAIGTTTLYNVPANGAGQYRVIWNSKVTTAAGTSSTLGPLTITYTDPDGTVTSTTMPGVGANPSTGIGESVTGNTTGTMLFGFSILLNCKASTVIQYSFGYASVAANAMQYNLHIRLEAM